MRTLFLFFALFWSLISEAQTYQLGQTYFDSTQYIEYQPGNIPLIIVIPHGGYLEPVSIPDRNCTGCVYGRDSYTQELGRILVDKIKENDGTTGMLACQPHIIINHLHRKKLDANRPIGDAADGNPEAEAAWYAFHDFINHARDTALFQYERALLIDLHGHGHPIQRIELGYLLSGTDLRKADSIIDTLITSSINGLVQQHPVPCLSQYIRGNTSLGKHIEDTWTTSLSAVPSPSIPAPLVGEAYFSGGYNTGRYGSHNGGALDAIQIECHQGMRLDSTQRVMQGASLANGLFSYVFSHYQNYNTSTLTTSPSTCFIIVGIDQLAPSNEPVCYPNPAHTHLQIASAAYPLTVALYNQTGQLVKQQTLEHAQAIFSLEAVPLGTYFLRMEGPTGQQYTQTIVKMPR